MSKILTTIEALWAEVAAKPKETTPRLLLADALRETGDDGDKAMAVTIQWCAKHSRWPKLRPLTTRESVRGWGWSPGHMGQRSRRVKGKGSVLLPQSEGNLLPVWITDRDELPDWR